MTCPKCGFDQPDGSIECGRCGIIFAKYQARKEDEPSILTSLYPSDSSPVEQGRESYLKDLLFYVDPEVNAAHIIGRGLVLAVLLIWGQKFIFSSIGSNYAGESFMHNINLPFHEAGHVLFRIFGQFMMTLGGSLMQLLVPLICLLTFLIKTKDPFAASVGLWWLGESLIDLAPYINDARDLKLILLGGVTGQDVDDYHDWEFILRKLGWLQYDHTLAGFAHLLGSLLILCAVAWGGFMLFRQFGTRRAKKSG